MGYTSTFVRWRLEARDTTMNGAMTCVYRLQGRWEGASVPVQSGRRWVTVFDKELFDRWGILTSRGIQKSYLVVLKNKNRKGTEIYEEYWLLDISKNEDYQDVVFVHKNP